MAEKKPPVLTVIDGAAPVGPRPPADEPTSLDQQCALLPMTDLGNMQRFIKRFGQDFLFVEQWGWLHWDGRRWSVEDADAAANRAVIEMVWAIRQEAEALRETAHDFKIDAKTWWSDRLQGWAKQSQDNKRITPVVKLARSQLAAKATMFDTDPMVFNVQNCTLRFMVEEGDGGQKYAKVEERPHARADLITKLAPVDYLPGAPAPAAYDAFLARVQPDEAMRQHLHCWGGVSLTGLPIAKLAFWYGRGRNGKSTAIDVWSWVAGDYAMSIPIESFLDQGRSRNAGQASPDIASLPGVRMLRTSEPEKGAKLAESFVKLVTGGEPLRARHLNRDFFEFRPAFKMTMSGNYRPRIDGTDEGIWRRFMLVPWAVIIPSEEQDERLPEKLRADAPGILNHLIGGLMYYLERGLPAPAEVLEATQQYREDSDPLQRFISDCLARHEGAGSNEYRVGARELYSLYAAWCRSVGEKIWSTKGFSRGLHDHGILRIKASQNFYCGIEMVKTEADFAGLDWKVDNDDG